MPSVGLVVLGGCLTMMVMPDEPIRRLDAPPLLEDGKRELPMIVVDAGHGGRDDGTKWFGVSERQMTLDMAFRVERLLKIAGFRTMLTRRDDTFISLEERVRAANKLEDAIFVSLHFNSDATGQSSGIETFYARQKAPPDSEWTWVGFFQKPDAQPIPDTSEMLAGNVQAALMNRTESRNRGIHPSNFYVVHHTRHPAVLIECGFLSNSFEMTLLRNDTYRERLAQGIVEGVMSYQKQRPAPGTPVNPPQMVKLERP